MMNNNVESFESGSVFNTATELVNTIEADEALEAALSDMESSNSNLNRAFFKSVDSAGCMKIYGLVKEYANSMKILKESYPGGNWHNMDAKKQYEKAQDHCYSERSRITGEITQITG